MRLGLDSIHLYIFTHKCFISAATHEYSQRQMRGRSLIWKISFLPHSNGLLCHELAVILLFFFSVCQNAYGATCSFHSAQSINRPSAALSRRAHTIMNNLFSHRCTFHSAVNFIIVFGRTPPHIAWSSQNVVDLSHWEHSWSSKNALFKAISSGCGNARVECRLSISIFVQWHFYTKCLTREKPLSLWSWTKKGLPLYLLIWKENFMSRHAN